GQLFREGQKRAWGWNLHHVLAMADQEANAANCARVKLDLEAFVARMRNSQARLLKGLPTGMNAIAPFLTEINGAEWEKAAGLGEEWLRTASDEYASVPNGDTARAVKTVIQHRVSFYERWAGRRLTTDEVRSMALTQAAEYVRVGAYLAKVLTNPFIFGADAPCMAPFVRAGAGPTVPVLYLERADY
ncbi:MAG TPA: hypothetical protein VJG48_02280, partial [Candidatus Paceibacterota bacterium]